MSEEQDQNTDKKTPYFSITATNSFAITLCIWAFLGLLTGLTGVFGGAVGLKNYLYPPQTPNMLQTLFGCETGDNCVVKKNEGGNGSEFLRAAYELQPGDLVHIDGPCYSGCSIFADYARPRVCVTSRTVMGFHQGAQLDNDSKIVGYFSPTYQKDLTLWVYSKGGFPNTWTNQPLLTMRYPEVLQFWPRCPTRSVLTKNNRLNVSSRQVSSTASPK